MNKRKRKSAEQPPPRLYREFNDYPHYQVIETARMLYALRKPFPHDSKSELHWNSLVRQAFDFLDNLDKACARVGEYRRKVGAAYRKAEKETALAEKLPLGATGLVPLNEAVKFITEEKHRHVGRSLEKFETLVLNSPRYFHFRGATEEQLREQIAHWRKNGMRRDEVIELRALWDEKAYRRYRIATAGKRERAKKRRAPWPDKKRIKVVLESSAREVKKQRKVDALHSAAQTGEIEA